jgi:tape measure domain-containing protein
MSKETADYEIRLKDAFSGPLAGLEKQMNAFERQFAGLNKLAGGFGIALGVSSLLSGISDVATKIVSLGANMEQTRISFSTMLGSAEKATATLKELVKFAEITPFRQDEVIQGAKQLLAYGFSADKLTTDLRRLGDVSAGLSIPLGDLVYLYGTIRTQGRAMTKDLMQFANRGIPIYDTLAKITGKSGMALQKMVEDGEIGFDVIEKAFIQMTAAGSMFGGLMEKQSKSLIGRWNTLQDKIEVMATSIGENMIPALGEIVERFISIVDVIPRLDFSPLIIQFTQLKNEIFGVFNAFGELFNLMGVSLTTFETLSIALRYISYLLRVAWTPIRVFTLLFTELLTLVQSSVGIFQGMGNVIAGAFTRDFAQVGKGIEQIGNAWTGFLDKAGSKSSQWWHDEKEGWSKLFDPLGNSAAGGSSYANGSSSDDKKKLSSTTDTKKGAGVEKIQSGNRNITIHINKLVDGGVNFHNTKYTESEAQMVERLKRVLLTIVNDANIVAN